MKPMLFDILLLCLALAAFAERLWKHACVIRFFREGKRQQEKERNPRPGSRQQAVGSREHLTPNTQHPTPEHPTPERPTPERPICVSILQPILSGDPTLSACLEYNLQLRSDCELEYLWLIDSDDAEAQRIGAELQGRYPERNLQIIVLPPPEDRRSPKMVKLIAGSRLATGEVLCVLDDDTMLPEGGVETCLAYLDRPGVGLAFGLPYYAHFANVWSALVACFVNSHSLLTYIPYTYLIEPFTINGMFYAVRRDTLADVGGFDGLEMALMDDFAVAQRFRQAGRTLAQTPVRHGISTHVEDMRHYTRLLQRWFIFPRETVMKSLPWRELAVAYGLGLISLLFPLLWLIVALLHPARWVWGMGGLYLVYSYAMFAHFNIAYLNRATPWRQSWWVPIIQLVLPIQLLAALCSPQRIVWRGHVMQIEPGGTFRFVRRRSS